MELLSHVRKISPETAVILMTAYGTIDTAVEAMKAGAYDFLTKPVNLDRLEMLLNFQTLVADLCGMELANSSMLDEATAAAHAPGTWVRSTRRCSI